MGAPNKEQLKAQALALGYDVDESITKRQLAELIEQGPAVPVGDAGEVDPGAQEDDRTEEEREAAIENPEGTPEFKAGEHADEPGSHDNLAPDTTVDEEVVGALKERFIETVQPTNLRQFGRYAASKYARPRL